MKFCRVKNNILRKFEENDPGIPRVCIKGDTALIYPCPYYGFYLPVSRAKHDIFKKCRPTDKRIDPPEGMKEYFLQERTIREGSPEFREGVVIRILKPEHGAKSELLVNADFLHFYDNPRFFSLGSEYDPIFVYEGDILCGVVCGIRKVKFRESGML